MNVQTKRAIITAVHYLTEQANDNGWQYRDIPLRAVCPAVPAHVVTGWRHLWVQLRVRQWLKARKVWEERYSELLAYERKRCAHCDGLIGYAPGCEFQPRSNRHYGAGRDWFGLIYQESCQACAESLSPAREQQKEERRHAAIA